MLRNRTLASSNSHVKRTTRGAAVLLPPKKHSSGKSKMVKDTFGTCRKTIDASEEGQRQHLVGGALGPAVSTSESLAGTLKNQTFVVQLTASWHLFLVG